MCSCFDPRGFLGTAQTLAASGDESSLRTAVGRAYYAVFLVTRDRLGVTQTDGTHAEVRNRIGRRNNGERLEDQLKQLYKLRTTADYILDPQDPAYQDWKANWQRAIGWANKLMPQVEKL